MPLKNAGADTYEMLLWDICTNAHRYQPMLDDNVLDLGAHFGIFSLYCASRGCHVKAYEPSPESIKELLHTVEVAKEIGLGEIRPVACAVWGNRGEGFLRKREPSTTNAIFTRKECPDGIPTMCVTLRDAMEDKTWDCCKVDVEGSEGEIFLSASVEDLARIDFLTMEIHNDLLPLRTRQLLVTRLCENFPYHTGIPVKVNGEPTNDFATLICWR